MVSMEPRQSRQVPKFFAWLPTKVYARRANPLRWEPDGYAWLCYVYQARYIIAGDRIHYRAQPSFLESGLYEPILDPWQQLQEASK